MRQTERCSSGLLQAFTAHPASVGESYWQHFLFATRFSARLMAASIAALLHAFVPSWFETTASEQIANMYRDINGRHQDDC